MLDYRRVTTCHWKIWKNRYILKKKEGCLTNTSFPGLFLAIFFPFKMVPFQETFVHFSIWGGTPLGESELYLTRRNTSEFPSGGKSTSPDHITRFNKHEGVPEMMNNTLKVSEVTPSPFHVNFRIWWIFLGVAENSCLLAYVPFVLVAKSAIITLDASKSFTSSRWKVLRDILIGGTRHQAAQASACTWVFPKNRGSFPPKWMVKIRENPIF